MLVESTVAKLADTEDQLDLVKKKKKFSYKWTCTVQPHVVQGLTVLIRSILKKTDFKMHISAHTVISCP